MFVKVFLQKNRKNYLFKIIVYSMILSSCTALKFSDESINVERSGSHYRFLEELDNWEFRSRITIRTNEETFIGGLHWIQLDDKSYLTVNGALGFGAIKIEIDDYKVLMMDSNGVLTKLENPTEDIFSFYGWHIPIRSLKYWLLGIENPLVEAKLNINEYGYLSSLQQGDWELRISRYKRYAGQNMPYILKINNSDTKISMVIDKWMFN